MHPRWTSLSSLPLNVLLLCLSDANSAYGGNLPLVLDLAVERQSTISNNALRRRGPHFISTGLDTLDTVFFANMTIGTPGQEIRFEVSTNVADTAVLSQSSSYCASNSCADVGTYNANQSSSYHYINSKYSTAYADGSSATGDWVTDSVTFAGIDAGSLQFAIEYQGQVNYGILGLGYVEIETFGSPYANLPFILYNKGLINIVGYSLWIDPTDASTGTLAMGGIDTNKFVGTFETLPITVQHLSYSYVTVNVAGMQLTTDKNGTVDLISSSFPAIIDSGASVLDLPSEVVLQIYLPLKAVYDSSVGSGVMKKSDLKNDTTIGMKFGSTTFIMPITDLVVSLNSTHYYMLIQPVNEGDSPDDVTSIVGLPLFMSAYAVFDFSHNQVSLAPLNKKPTANNITAINQNGVNGVSGVPKTSSTTSSSGSKGTSSSASNPTNSSSNGGLSTGAKAGIGIGVALGALLVALMLGFLIFRRRKRRAEERSRAENKEEEIGPQSNWNKAELPASQGQRYKELDGSHKPRATPGELDASGDGRLPGTPPKELPASIPGPYELPALPTSPTIGLGSSWEKNSNENSKEGSEGAFGSSAADQKTLASSSDQPSSTTTASKKGIARKPVPGLREGSSSAAS